MKQILGSMLIMFGHVAFAENACLDVQGMTCATCPLTVKTAIKKLDGVNEVKVSFKDKNALVTFDPNKITVAAITKAVDDVGYKATQTKCKN